MLDIDKELWSILTSEEDDPDEILLDLDDVMNTEEVLRKYVREKKTLG